MGAVGVMKRVQMADSCGREGSLLSPADLLFGAMVAGFLVFLAVFGAAPECRECGEHLRTGEERRCPYCGFSG